MPSTLACPVYIQAALPRSVRGGGTVDSSKRHRTVPPLLPRQSRDRPADTSTVAGGLPTEAVMSSASSREMPTLAVIIKMSRQWHCMRCARQGTPDRFSGVGKRATGFKGDFTD